MLEEFAGSRLRAVHDPTGDADAAAVGAGMVAARLAGIEALRLAVELIGAELGAEPRVAAVQGALAAGYAQGLAELTRREHESVVRSVLDSGRDAETALRTSDAQFHAVFTQAGMGIAIADLDGTVSDANTALLEMSGHTLDELIGRPSRGRRAGVAALPAGGAGRE